ncbi:MAG: QueT transporter family protein [Ruminococcaceae bacterium]|nr:QueT transporter family protein [Oscillospiraceae bacterium]
MKDSKTSLLPTKAAKRRQRLVNVCVGAITAALYVSLTLLSGLFGLSSGAIQVRISEALCVLPVFVPWSAVGLWIGCIIANALTNAVPWDIVFGSLATLLGALGALLLGTFARRARDAGRRKASVLLKILVPLPTVLSNAAIVPLVLMYAYGVTDMGYWLLVLTVGLGEIISAWVIGLLLLFLLEKNQKIFNVSVAEKLRR